MGCKQPRYPVLQPVGVGGYEGGATRLPTVMTEAELLAKMTGAGGLGKGDFRNKKKVVTVEVIVQGYPRSEDDEISFFFLGGNGQQSGYAMCDMLCGILAQVRESQACVKHLHHKHDGKTMTMVRCLDTSMILLMKISYTSSWQNIP